MHYDYDYDNDKKQDTKSVLQCRSDINIIMVRNYVCRIYSVDTRYVSQ